MTHRPILIIATAFLAGFAIQAGGAPDVGSVFHDTPLPLNNNNSVPVAAPGVPASPYAPDSPVHGTLRTMAINPDRALHVGDQVSLEIVEDKTGPAPKVVTATGEIDVPPLGRVHVAGKSCSEIEGELKRKLEADYYYTATVHVAIDSVLEVPVTYGKVYIAGYVKAPGPVLLDPSEHITVSNVILKAGGFAPFAQSEKVLVTRKQKNGEKQTFYVNVLGIWKAKGNLQDPEVLDGDAIYVAQKAVTF